MFQFIVSINNARYLFIFLTKKEFWQAFLLLDFNYVQM